MRFFGFLKEIQRRGGGEKEGYEKCGEGLFIYMGVEVVDSRARTSFQCQTGTTRVFSHLFQFWTV